MEWKLFDGDTSEFASAEWYKDRQAAHHLEEYGHSERIAKAVEFAKVAYRQYGAKTLSDLGCGDGGLLSLLREEEITAWGYDLAPANVKYAREVRGVDARLTDFSANAAIEYGDITVMTEVLEHLEDPHGTLYRIPSDFIVVSSPYGETGDAHYEFHLWAWDEEGYAKMVRDAGWGIIFHERVWLNQVILAVRS